MADVIHLEFDCVTGEKIIFQRSDAPGALVTVTLDAHGKRTKVQVSATALWLVLQTLNLQGK